MRFGSAVSIRRYRYNIIRTSTQFNKRIDLIRFKNDRYHHSSAVALNTAVESIRTFSKVRLLKMTRDMVAIVAAATTTSTSKGWGIGYKGQLPWNLPGDMKHFRDMTTNVDVTTSTADAAGNTAQRRNAVIMGRRTWESIPAKFRPLKGRINVILTRQSGFTVNDCNDVLVASSLQDASEQLCHKFNEDGIGTIYVIGGEQVYKDALDSGFVRKVLFTEVTNLPKGTQFDSFFPILDANEWLMQPCTRMVADKKGTEVEKKKASMPENDKENNTRIENKSVDDAKNENDEEKQMMIVDPKSGIQYRFLEYTKRNIEELQYLNLCREILRKGVRRGDRTGTGTLSIFGTQMRFDLRNGKLPLLTTKRTFWRGVAEELLWFISGNTNANELASKGIHIWDGNGSREFLDQRGLSHREVGDLGPVYGFQWRHFGAKYVDMHTDYTGQGVDQLAACIETIKNNPEDRRIIMSAWNPAALDDMALPPCHMFCQFFVDTVNNELSCQMYQRSADMGLGVPFNIASYALLTHLVAHVTGLKPGEFIHTIGDAHIYSNHIDALEEQLKREPRDFPTLHLNPKKTNIDDFIYDDLEVIGYNPHKMIKMKMAV